MASLKFLTAFFLGVLHLTLPDHNRDGYVLLHGRGLLNLSYYSINDLVPMC